MEYTKEILLVKILMNVLEKQKKIEECFYKIKEIYIYIYIYKQ
jgi:hypothetical protein